MQATLPESPLTFKGGETVPYAPKTWETGEQITATDLNHSEAGIQTAQQTAEAAIPAGASNAAVSLVKALLLDTSTRRQKLTWTSGRPTGVTWYDADGVTVIATGVYTWTGSNLTEVVVTAGTTTVTVTITYNPDGTIDEVIQS